MKIATERGVSQQRTLAREEQAVGVFAANWLYLPLGWP
jgi:hypothetical protein